MNFSGCLIATAVFLNYSLSAAQKGYGDPLDAYPTLPSWHERAIHVLTNACRMDPTGYRDTYVGNYNILLPQNYPPVDPLYWFIDLNRVARDHAEDIANDCGLQHSSCDGTSFQDRVYSYYTKSYSIAENIATGRSSPVQTMVQWIMDGDPPAGDKTGRNGDGHRANIMNGRYIEIGVGYAYGSVRWNHFWVQDFGGGDSDYDYHKVPAGSHFFESGNIIFMAGYHDTLGNPPSKASVIIDGSEHALSLHLGSQAKGSYSVIQPEGSSCREYYFIFTDASARDFRYPEGGMLATYGEGSCTKHYIPPESLSVNPMAPGPNSSDRIRVRCWPNPFSTNVNFRISELQNCRITNIQIYNVDGQIVEEFPNSEMGWDASGQSPGIYYVKTKTENNRNLVRKILLIQ
jgi:hypothetical protein